MPWQYQDEIDEWKDMDKAISKTLDRAQAEGHTRCAYSLETLGGTFNYSVDLRTNVQRNIKSGTTRAIRNESLFGTTVSGGGTLGSSRKSKDSTPPPPRPPPGEELWNAAFDGDLGRAQAALDLGADVNYRLSGTTPLELIAAPPALFSLYVFYIQVMCQLQVVRHHAATSS
jgi:hypothetical protein